MLKSKDLDKLSSCNPNLLQEFVVVYDYEPDRDDELRLRKGEKVLLISKDENVSGDKGWWVGQCGSQSGLFPCTNVVSQVRFFKNNIYIYKYK